MSSDDELYIEARRHVRETGHASIGQLQRKLQLGYNRAASLVERMEAEGFVTRADHAGRHTLVEA